MIYILENDLRYKRSTIQIVLCTFSSVFRLLLFSFIWKLTNLPKNFLVKNRCSFKRQELTGWTSNFRPEVPGWTKKSENGYSTGYREDENYSNRVPNQESFSGRFLVKAWRFWFRSPSRLDYYTIFDSIGWYSTILGNIWQYQESPNNIWYNIVNILQYKRIHTNCIMIILFWNFFGFTY